MASSRRLLCILLLSLVLPTWTWTSWTITSYYTWNFVTSGTSSSFLARATPTVENPRAVETITTTTDWPSHSLLAFEQVVFEADQATYGGLRPTTSTDYDYLVITTFTKPSGCLLADVSSTETSSTALRVPSDLDLAGTVTPTSTTASTRTRSFYNSDVTVVTRGWVLNPTDVPPAILEEHSMSPPYDYELCEARQYNFDGDFSMCTEWFWPSRRERIGGGFRCSNGKFFTWGLRPWGLVLVIVLPYTGAFFLMGLVQSFKHFHNLMRGREARRGLPSLFTCLAPPFTLILLKLRYIGFAARSEEEQHVLTKQWAGMHAGTRLKLWLRYGFTRGYPPMLGDPPPRALRRGLHEVRRQPVPYHHHQSGRGGDGGNATTHREADEADPPPPYTRVLTPSTSTNMQSASPDPTAPALDRETPFELQSEIRHEPPHGPPRYGEWNESGNGQNRRQDE